MRDLTGFALVLILFLTACEGSSDSRSGSGDTNPSPQPTYNQFVITEAKIDPNPFTAGTHMLKVRAGTESATVSSEVSLASGYPVVSNTRLKIFLDNGLVFDRALNDRPVGLTIVGFQEADHPVVMLDTFSGGAHCCFSTLFVEPSTVATNVHVQTIDFGDADPAIKRLVKDGDFELLTVDVSPRYKFASFAGSAFPLFTLGYQNHQVVDTTKLHPAMLREDAEKLLHSYMTQGADSTAGQSPLAAYLADEYSLGEGTAGWERVKSLYQMADRDHYFEILRAWLVQNGYEKGGPASTPSPQAVQASPIATPVAAGLGALTFHGYACKDGCEGHQRGYDWAEEKGISDPDDCPIDPHNSHSFTEGCWAEAGREGP